MLRHQLLPHEKEAGYALIELLASLTILALILAMVPGTLRLGKRAWETPRGTEETPAAATLAFAAHNLKSALMPYQTDQNGLPQLVFDGEAHHLGFVAELSNGPQGGGLYRVDIGTPSAAAGNVSPIAVSFSLFHPDARDPAAPGEVRNLDRAYSALEFRYFGPPEPGAPASWLPNWPRRDRLPDLVDIHATSRNAEATPSAQYRAELKLRPML